LIIDEIEHLRKLMPSLSKKRTFILGTSVALPRAVANSMDEVTVKTLSDVVNFLLIDRGAAMMTAGMQIAIGAVALILILLLARMKRKNFRARRTKTHKPTSVRLFEKKPSPERKPCPNCAEQLPLSAIICGKCDYNFLAARPGRGQNLLPSPEAPIHDIADQRISSTGL
jgi:hypothetical protein